jgi:hypothetical protein
LKLDPSFPRSVHPLRPMDGCHVGRVILNDSVWYLRISIFFITTAADFDSASGRRVVPLTLLFVEWLSWNGERDKADSLRRSRDDPS